jgi:ABC-type uncharacterized transport system
MASQSSPKTSFSRTRRWSILFLVVASATAVIALVGMLNYLAARHYVRFSWSSHTKSQLSPQTLTLLNSITNDVKVTVYFDKQHELYTLVDSMLNEYRLKNHHITVEIVDYVNNPAGAAKVKSTYGLRSAAEKDLVIFEGNGRTNVVDQSYLGDYAIQPILNKKGETEFVRELKAFKGELYFNASIMRVTSNKSYKAYLVMQHGTPNFPSEDKEGYYKFLDLLHQNYVDPQPLFNLFGTNTVPSDCNLLLVLGPTKPFLPEEVDKIHQYLNGGGRMLVLFNFGSANRNLGLESLLADDWNIEIGHNIVRDFDHSSGGTGVDLVVENFNGSSPVVNSLQGSQMQFYQPRSVSKKENLKETASSPKVEELAVTSPKAILDNTTIPPNKPISLMVSAEKGTIKGVYAEKGVTRIIAVGDSLFLSNLMIDSGDNRLFAANALNWLLDRAQLMQGIAPQQITEYKILMTKSQFRTVEWVVLAGMPGGVLLLGGIVWLRRRS